jgi:membrane protease YdiL (CAAX protease family)
VPDTTNSDRESRANWGTRLPLIAFLLLYGLMFAVRLPRVLFSGEALVLIQAAAYGIFSISGIFVFRHTLISDVKSWRSSAFSNTLWLLGAFVASTVMVSIAAYPAYSMGYEDVGNAKALSLMIEAIGKPLTVLVIGLCGPITEELIYRAFLIGRVKTKFPLWICVILSSLLFAGMHLNGLSLLHFLAILPLFVQALILGIAYAATGTITVPLLMHVMNNMTAILLYGGY